MTELYGAVFYVSRNYTRSNRRWTREHVMQLLYVWNDLWKLSPSPPSSSHRSEDTAKNRRVTAHVWPDVRRLETRNYTADGDMLLLLYPLPPLNYDDDRDVIARATRSAPTRRLRGRSGWDDTVCARAIEIAVVCKTLYLLASIHTRFSVTFGCAHANSRRRGDKNASRSNPPFVRLCFLWRTRRGRKEGKRADCDLKTERGEEEKIKLK